MAKLTELEKRIRKNIQLSLTERGGKLFSFPDTGLVVLVVPALPNAGERCKFAHITWTICGAEDKFNQKRGEFEALMRWHDMTYLPLPLPHNTYSKDDVLEYIAEDIESTISNLLQ